MERTKLSTRLRLTFLAMITLASLTLAGAVAEAGQAGPQPPANTVLAVPVVEDYCGNGVVDVPDTGPSFDFHKACAIHDDCYSNGGTEADRRACDTDFLNNMLATCAHMWRWPDPRLANCRSVAFTYYLGVRLGGWAFFPYGAVYH